MKYKKKGEQQLTIGDDVIVVDIETDGLNIETTRMKWFGAFSFKYNTYYFYTHDEKEYIQRLIDEHKVVVGYNSKDFDIPIMENNGYNFDYKIRIDLMRVLFNPLTRKSVRENIIKINGKVLKDLLPNHKLKTVGQVLNLSVEKGDIDYKIFYKEEWNNLESNEILKYLYRDVKLTKELFEFMYTEFLPFKEFMNIDDQRKYNWYRTSTGSYTYKVICHRAEIKEEYNDKCEYEKYPGGYVSSPNKESCKGNIYLLDFTSEYPHGLLSGNLYSYDCDCCTDDEKWSGNDMFPIIGKYCSKKLGKIERVIKDLILLKLKYKQEKDPREYAVKIMVNTLYGISGAPVFKNVYNYNTASDCTLIGRNMIKYARKVFEDNGYELIYTDTDSVYLKDVYDDKERMLKVRDKIIEDIKMNLPFPQDTFNMTIDDEIKAIWFFKDYNNELKKKNYIYITKDNRFKIKGLPIIKSDVSKLSQKVMKILAPQIIEKNDIKFSRKYIRDLVHCLLKEDITLVANFYKVKELNQYKSKNCIQAQISKAYGFGEHWLVPNNIIGKVGKTKKYCNIEEAKDLSLDDLDLNKVWDTELCIFIEDWEHPLFTKKMERVELDYQKKQEENLQKYFKSDLFDSDSVGADITNEEYLENEKWFEMN